MNEDKDKKDGIGLKIGIAISILIFVGSIVYGLIDYGTAFITALARNPVGNILAIVVIIIAVYSCIIRPNNTGDKSSIEVYACLLTIAVVCLLISGGLPE